MIKCLDETVPEIYIGSTNDYKRRQSCHKSNCNNPNNKNYNLKLYRFIRSKGGFDKFTFKVIEECEEDDKLEVEKMYIDMYDPELNTHKYDFDKKEWQKEWQKEYSIKNKGKIAEQKKEYYDKNKDTFNEKICCRACKCEITKRNFKEHCRTKKHIANQTVISQ